MSQTLTIAVGADESNWLDDPKKAYKNMMLYAPASIGGVTTVMVSPKRAEESVLADFVALQSGGSDVVLTAAKATPITLAGAAALLLQTDTTVAGADEVYEVTGEPNLD